LWGYYLYFILLPFFIKHKIVDIIQYSRKNAILLEFTQRINYGGIFDV